MEVNQAVEAVLVPFAQRAPGVNRRDHAAVVRLIHANKAAARKDSASQTT